MSSVRIHLHPSASEAKELNLVIRLSTKGMIHSLSKQQITEAQIGSEYPQGRPDLWVLRADLGLSDLLLGERVDHSLGGQTDDQVKLLSLRGRWMQMDPDRGH